PKFDIAARKMNTSSRNPNIEPPSYNFEREYPKDTIERIDNMYLDILLRLTKSDKERNLLLSLDKLDEMKQQLLNRKK
ncbi:MAG: hypothetical protein WDA09_10165, partial [Bacteriovoracaceae bacterium]